MNINGSIHANLKINQTSVKIQAKEFNYINN